ncbi:ROK family protein [Corynebacterium sp. 320]|uniref:polyphosphate--glucose phosphotransferase n=1 Tax=Corynebacterium TaxID=1716 RepID=UPI00125CABC7|nr:MULTISPECIES: ROK family protein [Corynebacterium]KAB1503745.1 ROK family protein [Corynebacterium sp. 320]KAB1553155.1 ROK family protein [Corynebacterium sp. 321]KAB1553627.1 ROK family protein [Corynebacterium sp. 319]KAB3527881.1 ROK family protein [Corynebacterium sp. 250]KAB3540630.1 ROK family protein [Corynebacterium sp. 366]
MAENNPHHGFGVDIGGSGIKGAIVDLSTGELVSDRFKIKTPQPATPDAVAGVVRTLVDMAGWDGPVGITVPAVVRGHIARSAANIDSSWIGTDVLALFSHHLDGRAVSVLNDADAAGIAEVELGDEEAKRGAVLLLTLGTGIGSAMLYNGTLFPNTELGHLPFGDTEAEKWASSAVREREDLSYKEWGRRVDQVLHRYSALFSPDRFIIGGGVSRKFDKWSQHITVEQPVVAAQLRNQAGIIGAAIAVRDGIQP